MEQIVIQSCPLCESKELKQAMACVDSFVSGEEFSLYTCEYCKFLFTQNFPDEEAMDRYYEAPDYVSHSDTHKGLMNQLYHVVRRMMLRRKVRRVIRESHRKEGRLLDYGAGTGYFAAAMQRKGWSVEAMEKSERARSFAQAHFGLECLPPEKLADCAPEQYDVITLWHVMEHIEKVNEAWATFHRLLKADGILVAAVPNGDSYDAQKYGKAWAAYDVPRHLWHFTPDTMRLFGAKHDFVLAGSYPMPFDAFYISMLSEKGLRRRFPLLRGTWSGMVGGLNAIGNKERSSSIVYVFKKRDE
jgi:SAM-dependent methyltransferase